MSAVNGTNTLTNYTYSYTNPATSKDTLLPYTFSQSDSYLHNATAVKSYDVLNHLLEWNVTPGTGSLISNHDYKYAYDGNGNRTTINITTTNVTTLAYNAKSQMASITDNLQNVIPMTYTGPGQSERVSAGWVATNSLTPNGSATYTYGSGLLSNTDSLGTTHYTRDAGGTLVAQRVPGTTTNYYYLFDRVGSVIKMVDASGNVVATYMYCPTGNAAEPSFGLAAPGNPWQYLGEYEDTATKMLYGAFSSTDSNSGVTIQLCPVPIGGITLPCSAPLPAQIQTPAGLTCPLNSAHPESGIPGAATYQTTGGPEMGGGEDPTCHVNAQGGNSLLHIVFDVQTGEYSSGILALGTDAAQAAQDVAYLLGIYIAPSGGNLVNKVTQLALYPP